MNRLSVEKRAQVIASLVEGNSIRATVRITGVAKNTVTKLLVDMGVVCSVHMDRAMRDLACERVECDEGAFNGDVDYAQLVKIYGKEQQEKRYSPAVCLGADRQVITGNPNPALISTSYIERQNLTMRMSMRRFTRLTNAFSKKVENLAAAVSLHFAYYNFCRVHKTLGTTPAVAAGVADHAWTLSELIGLLEQAEAVPVRRGRYAKTRPRVNPGEISE